jgi:CRISPR-associated protein Cas5t
LEAPRGRLTLPVLVDHVGSAATRYVTGDLVEVPLEPPTRERMPRIQPKESTP